MPPTLSPRTMFTLGIWFTVIGLIFQLTLSHFLSWFVDFLGPTGEIGYVAISFVMQVISILIIPFGAAMVIGAIVLRSLIHELAAEE